MSLHRPRARPGRNGSVEFRPRSGEPTAAGRAHNVVQVRDDRREDEFRACYAELYPKVASYLMSLTRHRETAHDLAQETFARLFDRWSRVEEPMPYAFRIATNLARRTWRGNQRDARTLHALDDGSRHVRDDTEGVDLRLAVDALPGRYREVVLLHYYADLPVASIATSLGRPAGTVKRQLAEARERLGESLGGVR
jgi:RNA polymerase sigma-70 factor, ECF subfamily